MPLSHVWVWLDQLKTDPSLVWLDLQRDGHRQAVVAVGAGEHERHVVPNSDVSRSYRLGDVVLDASDASTPPVRSTLDEKEREGRESRERGRSRARRR